MLTSPKFLRANLSAVSEADFFESGERFVDMVFETIDLRFTPDFTPMSILEFGCGVGRLAIPLARRAEVVTAVDRSPAMLAAARAEAQRHGIESIEFCTPAELLAQRRKFDLVVCNLVLQRIRAHAGLALLRELLGFAGPGGIIVFQFPYRMTTARAIGPSRWLRERVPVINGFLNLLRRKSFHQPFIATHRYDVEEVLGILDEREFKSSHVVFERQPGFLGAVVFAKAPLSLKPAGHVESAGHRADRPIDIRQAVGDTSMDDLNRAAEQYFASLTDWDHHLAKPFSQPEETPRLLIGVGTLLQGLRLVPEMIVLEFGAGTGWLGRSLTQLGCRVILLDVSATALQMAQTLYERQPVIGAQPAPQFLLFNGRRIDLPDDSVDRIVNFHAFHHTPNPHEVLREFARILRPGGIAAFVEPGPRHSRTPQSQFEMATYGVVENDIDVHDIWRTARACGFTDLKLSAYNGSPFQLSLSEYEDLLAGGDTSADWLISTRDFLRSVRTFFLYKQGTERADSRTQDGLACSIRATLATPSPRPGEPFTIEAEVTNSGTATWLPPAAAYGGVVLGAHLNDATGTLLRFDLATTPLTHPPREIAPGETLTCRLKVPPQPAGRYLVIVDCVAARVSWFAQVGSRPATVPVEVFAVE